jgi:hypothetical protein
MNGSDKKGKRPIPQAFRFIRCGLSHTRYIAYRRASSCSFEYNNNKEHNNEKADRAYY